MNSAGCLIITTISPPNRALETFASQCSSLGMDFIIAGDRKSPPDFSLPGSDYWSLERQKASRFTSAAIIPENHYARKNIAYLAAIEKGHVSILETDDDNLPYDHFWKPRERRIEGELIRDTGWVNVYRLFTGEEIWPRGYPLEEIQVRTTYGIESPGLHECPIQQGLSDDNPDVDAVYRLTRTLPVKFRRDLTFVLGKGSWCPFNSQNTLWFREAFPLLYLPSKCSFRMTDIWRSFVAQRIAWEYGWRIAFHSPSLIQERNEHNLLQDLEEEVPGYLNNASLCRSLESLPLSAKQEDIFRNLTGCYELLIEMGLVGKEETDILASWIEDLQQVM